MSVDADDRPKESLSHGVSPIKHIVQKGLLKMNRLGCSACFGARGAFSSSFIGAFLVKLLVWRSNNPTFSVARISLFGSYRQYAPHGHRGQRHGEELVSSGHWGIDAVPLCFGSELVGPSCSDHEFLMCRDTEKMPRQARFLEGLLLSFDVKLWHVLHRRMLLRDEDFISKLG